MSVTQQYAKVLSARTRKLSDIQALLEAFFHDRLVEIEAEVNELQKSQVRTDDKTESNR